MINKKTLKYVKSSVKPLLVNEPKREGIRK